MQEDHSNTDYSKSDFEFLCSVLGPLLYFKIIIFRCRSLRSHGGDGGCPSAKRRKTSNYIFEKLFRMGENSDVKIDCLDRVWCLHKVRTSIFEIQTFLSGFQMVFDKMAAISPDFKWLGFQISDPI